MLMLGRRAQLFPADLWRHRAAPNGNDKCSRLSADRPAWPWCGRRWAVMQRNERDVQAFARLGPGGGGGDGDDAGTGSRNWVMLPTWFANLSTQPRDDCCAVHILLTYILLVDKKNCVSTYTTAPASSNLGNLQCAMYTNIWWKYECCKKNSAACSMSPHIGRGWTSRAHYLKIVLTVTIYSWNSWR